MKISFLFLFSFYFSWLSGQSVIDISIGTKLPAKTSKFKIIGKNNDGIVVRLYGSEDVISVYDNSLRLVTNKTIDYKNKVGLLQHIMLNKSGAMIFYLEQQKKFSILFAQPVNAKFIEIGKPLSVDTIFDRKELIASNLRFKSSLDQSYLLIYYPYFSENKVQSIKFICFDRGLRTLYNKTIPLNRDEIELEESKSVIDNNGNSFLILKPEHNGQGNVYDVQHIDSKGDFSNYQVATDKQLFGEPSFDIDNKNGNMVMTAFYDDKLRPNEHLANGFLYASFDPDNGTLVRNTYTQFSKEFITELTGREIVTSQSLYTFTIRKTVLRNDGGAIIVAESYIKDSHDQSIPMGVQPGYNSFRSTENFQFNDIIAFSINPTGTLEWHSVMRKKQVSEDDNGIYSSFMLMNEKEKLRFIYLEDISTNSSVYNYYLSSEGMSDKDVLLNQEERDLMLLPKIGKQISPEEVVIPSYKNGSLRLVKITF